MGRTNAVMDAFVQRLIQSVVEARIKIYPTLPFMLRLASNKQYFRPQQTRVSDEIPPRLDDNMWTRRTEFSPESGFDCFGVDSQRLDRFAVMRRQSAAEVQQLKRGTLVRAAMINPGCVSNG
jgi:hypothetical protein